MIRVLCYSCHTYIANTDAARLDWPLFGEMFTVVYQGWFLRPGKLNLDIFCPVCGAFPFSHDPYTAGGNAVGKNLMVRGEDGKPVVRTVKQLLLDSREPEPLSRGEPSQNATNHMAVRDTQSEGGLTKNPPQFGERIHPGAASGRHNVQGQHLGSADGDAPKMPENQKASPGGKPALMDSGLRPLGVGQDVAAKAMPESQMQPLQIVGRCPCGAKITAAPRFHKKGCPVHKPETLTGPVETPKVKAPSSEYKEMDLTHPHLAEMEARVVSGPDLGGEPTQEELADLSRGRSARMREKEKPQLRPGEGYAPQAPGVG